MNLKLKRIALAVLGILLTVSIAMSLFFYNNTSKLIVSADIVEKEDILQDTSYAVNQKKTFPLSVDVDGAVASNGVVVYPNGTAYAVNETPLVLDVVGEYTIKYFTGSLTVYDKFFVTDKLYSLSDNSEGNVIKEYVQEAMDNPATEGDYYLNTDSDVTVARGIYGYKNDPTKGTKGYGRSTYGDGLIVKMKQGVKFSYAEPINLNETSEDGLSNIMSFSLMAVHYYGKDGLHYSLPEAGLDGAYKNIVQHAYITLTDAYDPNKYVQVLLMHTDSLYARASTNDMSSKALSVGNSRAASATVREVYYGSKRSIVWENSYGSSCGVKSNIKGYNAKIHLRYDNEKGILYWGAERNADIRGGTTVYTDTKNIDHNIIMDLKDPAITGGASFSGFTTGEVYVSVHFADAYINEAARMDIYSIGNKNAREIITESGNVYSDTKAPVIKVDANPTVNNGVYAKAGVGQTFTIPSATATDVNMSGDVSVNVYRGYTTNNVSAVKVVNGKFAIEKEDVYYIVYTARDSYGNVSEEVFKVYALANKDNIIFDDSQRVPNGTKIMTETLLPLGEKVSTLNNYEDLKVKIEFISDRESFVYADLKNGQEIDEFWANDHYFTTTYQGTYTVRFTCSDNATSRVIEYNFTTVPSDVISFAQKPFIERYLIKDATYSFQTVDAIQYVNGMPEVAEDKADLSISFDGGAFTPIADINNVKITGSNTAQLKATYNGYSVLSDVAIIRDVNFAAALNYAETGDPDEEAYLDGGKYFYYEDGAFAVQDSSDLVYISRNNAKSNTLKFINMLSMVDFSLEYTIKDSYANFEQISFIFTDPYQTENVFKLALYKKAGAPYFSINGEEVKLTGAFASASAKSVKYNAKSGVLSFSGAPEKTTYIPEISFSSPFVYLDIVIEGITGEAGVLIKDINGQRMKTELEDSKAPTIISPLLMGIYGIGDVVTLPAVMFADVLSGVQYDTVLTSFIYERKTTQTSIDGVLLDGYENSSRQDYQVVIGDLGEYRYNYEAYDAFGNRIKNYMIVNAIDKDAPTIQFKGQIKEDVVVKIKVGTTIKLNYTLSDNITETERLTSTLMVRDCKNSIIRPINTKSIKFDTVGQFEVSVVCQDLAGNVTIKSFDVIVSA